MLMKALPVMLVCSGGSIAMAQTLQWVQRFHDPAPVGGPHNLEVSLAVNQLGTEVLVAWVHSKFDANTNPQYDEDAWYNVLVEGQPFNPSAAGRLPYTAPPHGKNTGDPYIAFSGTTGKAWATCIDSRVLG